MESARVAEHDSERVARSIAIFLTLVSASVVSLALVGQATDFDGRFDVFTLLLFSIVLLVGTLTLLRVFNGGDEDLAYVIGMNRLRAAYTEIDPGIDRYFVASRHDDERGIGQTYAYFPHGSEVVQPLASSMMFILVVDAVVAGVLAGLAANAADASGAVVAIAAAAASIAYFTAWSWHFLRRYAAFQARVRGAISTPVRSLSRRTTTVGQLVGITFLSLLSCDGEALAGKVGLRACVDRRRVV